MTNADVFQLVAAHLHPHPALLLLASTCSSARQGVRYYLANHIPIPGVSPERAWHLLVRGRLTPRSSLAETLWVLERCRTAYNAPPTPLPLPQPAQMLAQWGSQLAQPLATQMVYRLPVMAMLRAWVLHKWDGPVDVCHEEAPQLAGYLKWLLHHGYNVTAILQKCVYRYASLPWANMLISAQRPDLLDTYLATAQMSFGYYAAALYKSVFEAENPDTLRVLLHRLPVSPRNVGNIMTAIEPRIEFERADSSAVIAFGTRGWSVPLTPHSETIYTFRRRGGRCTLHGPLPALLGFAGRLPQPQN